MKDILIGVLKREKIAETALQKSEAETERRDSLLILYLDHLLHVRDMEDDAKCSKIMLSLHEEKVGEIKFSTPTIEKNPELIRSSLENTKLREQLQRYQSFSRV